MPSVIHITDGYKLVVYTAASGGTSSRTSERGGKEAMAVRRPLAALCVFVLATMSLASCVAGQSYTPVVVSGAGSAAVNGTYAYSGIVNGKPAYVNGSYSIEWFPNATPYWKMGLSGYVIDYYCNLGDTATPPSTGWQGGCGAVSGGVLPYPTASGGGELTPEIDVRGSGVSIADGDMTPSVGDLTDFGIVGVPSGSDTHAFTIHNTGDAALSITTPLVVTGHSDFTVTVQPATSVTAGGSTTFSVHFDPVADGVRAASIEITNGDVDENPYTFSVQGTGDGTGPTVSSVAPSLTMIADANVGAGDFTLTVDWSEAMNTGIDPTLVFSPLVGSTLVLSSDTWVDGDTYRATYNVADASVDANSVTVDVTGGQDVYGNAQQNYAPVHEFEIDTQNPTVVIAANDLGVYDGDVGADRFTVTATFSEAMNSGVVPTLTFTPNPSTTFTNPSGAWSGGNAVYTWTYDVADTGVTVADVDVGVTGAQDVAGNTQVANTHTDYVDIDTQNPTVGDRCERRGDLRR